MEQLGFRSGRFDQRAGYSVNRPRGGGEWLLIVTLGGNGYHRSGRSVVTLRRGTALLYAPRAPQHYGTASRDRRWELAWTHFPSDGRLQPLLHWPERAGAGLLELNEAFEPVVEAMDDLVAWQQGASPLRHGFAVNALERALLWCSAVNPLNPPNRMDPRVRRAVEIIAADPTGPFGVTKLSAEVGISASRLSHLFKQEVGSSFPSYVESRRMERAEDLLRMTDWSVSDIAASVGYDDPLYFSRRFRLRTGLSPRAWRTERTRSTG